MTLPRYLRSFMNDHILYIINEKGKDGAGIVEDVGANVVSFKKGDRVFSTLVASGSLAEYGVVESNRVFPLPKEMSYDEGAALGIPYFTAYRALFHRGNELGSWRMCSILSVLP